MKNNFYNAIYFFISICINNISTDWLLQNDEGIGSAIANSSVEYSNDTLILHSDLTVPTLKIKNLNGTIIDQLMDDLFIINRAQKING